MKKVIILCSALVFGLLTCHDASAVDSWEATIEISELTDQSAVKKKSAKAFEERLNALEALAGKSEVEKYTKSWFVKGKWMGNKQHPLGSRNNGKVIGHLWSPKTNLAKFKQDLKAIEEEISKIQETKAEKEDQQFKEYMRQRINEEYYTNAEFRKKSEDHKTESSPKQTGAYNDSDRLPFLSSSDEYSTEEEEWNMTHEKIIENDKEETSAPTEYNKATTSDRESTFPNHYRRTLWFDDDTPLFDT